MGGRKLISRPSPILFLLMPWMWAHGCRRNRSFLLNPDLHLAGFGLAEHPVHQSVCVLTFATLFSTPLQVKLRLCLVGSMQHTSQSHRCTQHGEYASSTVGQHSSDIRVALGRRGALVDETSLHVHALRFPDVLLTVRRAVSEVALPTD